MAHFGNCSQITWLIFLIFLKTANFSSNMLPVVKPQKYDCCLYSQVHFKSIVLSQCEIASLMSIRKISLGQGLYGEEGLS
jgi:hypothetical protein